MTCTKVKSYGTEAHLQSTERDNVYTVFRNWTSVSFAGHFCQGVSRFAHPSLAGLSNGFGNAASSMLRREARLVLLCPRPTRNHLPHGGNGFRERSIITPDPRVSPVAMPSIANPSFRDGEADITAFSTRPELTWPEQPKSRAKRATSRSPKKPQRPQL
jgi:hypothetical protein